jgi:hypothetical protein
MRRRLQSWTVYQWHYWWEEVYKTEQYIYYWYTVQLCKRILISNITDILFSFVNMFSSVILLIYCSLCKRLLISNITDILFSFVNVFSSVILLIWEHVYKAEQYISNITDENTFTKLNSISVILLLKTRLQNWTVYQ